MVDHQAAARAARDAIWGLRRSADFKRGAEAIQDKHGSRKSGLPQTGRGQTGRGQTGRGKGRSQRAKPDGDDRQGRFEWEPVP